MKELIGKEVKIIIDFYGEKLFYRARILFIDEFKVSFLDKYKKIYLYNMNNVIEIKEVNDNEKENEKG
jgi:hypothetical protein